MIRLVADLHIHTALSPCAMPEMTPRAVAQEAARRGLAMIAVCDHNAAGNAAAVAEEAARLSDGPVVIPGVELTTAEEAHVLGWFPDAAAALAAAAEAMAGTDPGLPGAASRLGLSPVVELIHAHGGLAVAAHVDRGSFSVPSQLGFIPPDVPFDGLEISAAGAARGRAARFASRGLALVSSSDAHSLEEIGAGLTVLDVEGLGFGEVALALRGAGGRGCSIA
jgi:3',5'-nucleoside bisphosphate phosphatase